MPQTPRHTFPAHPRPALRCGLILLAAGAASAAVPPKPGLLALHTEHDPVTGQNYDELFWTWGATAAAANNIDHSVLRQAIDRGGSVVLGTFPGGQPGFKDYRNTATAAGRLVAYYQVTVFDHAGNSATSSMSSCQQLLPDPFFAAGPSIIFFTPGPIITGNLNWIQTRTTLGGQPGYTNFISGSPGSYHATLGGIASSVDEMDSADRTPMTVSAPAAVQSNSTFLSLKGVYSATTQESPGETIAYDVLVADVWNTSTGLVLSHNIVASNLNANGVSTPFTISLDYNALKGKPVGIKIYASNDVILPTTFTVGDCELDLDITYP